MIPLKGGHYKSQFHRKGAEHTEILLYFFAFRQEGGKQKSTTLWNCQSKLKITTLNTCFDWVQLLNTFHWPFS